VSKITPANLAASVREKLLNLSRKTSEPLDLVLTRYALERLLYRIGVSPFADRFILKGALLLEVLGAGSHRPTRDLDLLGFGEYSDEQIADLFRKLCEIEVEPDGLLFDQESIRVTEIREELEYQGKRVLFFAHLAGARIKMQVDVAFGDAVTPEAKEIDYPTILDFPAPRIRAYPIASVISEKLQTMVAFGMPNSRMKDYFDIWMLAQEFPFEGVDLVNAIRATFDRRRTEIPKLIPLGLSEEFALDREKGKQWESFPMRFRHCLALFLDSILVHSYHIRTKDYIKNWGFELLLAMIRFQFQGYP
jgi:predicted nucleotidyltransferase component of viral defense system